MLPADAPVLWHLELSHYNEKVRWALDLKRVPHRRRPLPPGAHLLVARRLTGGACETTPVLTIGGRSLGESAVIIAELERRHPDPPLYPADPDERRRALELETLCDVELGEHMRRVAYEELLGRPEVLLPLFAHDQPPLVRGLLRAGLPLVRRGIGERFEVREDTAETSRARVRAAADLLEEQLGEREYLVGDRFSVADLTVAALMYPVARSQLFPYPLPSDLGPRATAFLDELAQRPLGRWVTSVWERHRATPGVHRSWRRGGPRRS